MMVVWRFRDLVVLVYVTVTAYAIRDAACEEISQKNIITWATDDKLPSDTAQSRASREVHRTAPWYQQTQFYYLPVPGQSGLPGPPGRNGEPGIAGVIGTTGYSGNNGNHGNDGIAGPVGQPGNKGQKGDVGLDGPCGIPGSDGVPGVNGYRGEIGPAGPRGRQGPDGKRGAVGPAGPRGVDGPIGFSGKPGSLGPKGPPGTFTPTNAINRNYRAFSVALNSNVIANDGDMVIIWDHEFSNIGGDFHLETGTFNVTIPGTYFFRFHVSKTSRQTYPHVQLVKNGESVVSVIDYGPNDSDDSSDNSVILTLSQGDVIWMVLQDEREVSSSPYRFTTFSGFLIFPMPI